jgi:hypothetical protein
MDSPKDSWHVARPILAKQYLREFDVGLISARAPKTSEILVRVDHGKYQLQDEVFLEWLNRST